MKKTIAYAFGDKLREVRERKKLTLKTVARSAGVSESLVSQIERNKVSPSIDTLMSLADVLDVDVEYLFQDYRKDRAVCIVRNGQREKRQYKGVVYERLSRPFGLSKTHGIEALYLVIAPGSEQGDSEYGHPGQEFGVILSGRGVLAYGKRTYALNSGDSVTFSSDIPHTLKNVGEEPLTAVWVVSPPRSADRAGAAL